MKGLLALMAFITVVSCVPPSPWLLSYGSQPMHKRVSDHFYNESWLSKLLHNALGKSLFFDSRSLLKNLYFRWLPGKDKQVIYLK